MVKHAILSRLNKGSCNVSVTASVDALRMQWDADNTGALVFRSLIA